MSDSPLLEAVNLTAGYGRVAAISGVDVSVDAGSVIAVVGPNGAGKTTLALTLAGFTQILGGTIFYNGVDITEAAPHIRVRKKIALVAEGRHIFGQLSVQENLGLCLLATPGLSPTERNDRVDREFERFPILGRRRNQQAGTLSGGEQQMLAISRALLQDPALLILDEPSTGLAPQIRRQIFETITDVVAQTGCGCLLIEQRARAALAVAEKALVLERGSVVRAASSEQLLEDEELHKIFLGGKTERES